MKYNTYEELIEAYRTGELDETTPLMMDNDECFVFTEEDENGESEQLFQGDGYRDIVDIANAAGIPTEWV